MACNSSLKECDSQHLGKSLVYIHSLKDVWPCFQGVYEALWKVTTRVVR